MVIPHMSVKMMGSGLEVNLFVKVRSIMYMSGVCGKCMRYTLWFCSV